jgi:tetratricopeptide (TPR) repeat protein
MKAIFFFAAGALLLVCACSTLDTQTDFAAGRQAFLRGDAAGAASYFGRVAQSDPNYSSNTVVLRESIWTYVGRVQYNSGRYGESRQNFERALSYINDDHLARLYLGLVLLRTPSTPAAPKPFSLQEVTFALREGVEPRRVTALLRDRGVGFDVTKENEAQLRSVGADNALMDEIRKIRAETIKRGSPGDPSTGVKEVNTAFDNLIKALDYATTTTIQGKFWDPDGQIRGQLKNGLALVSAREPDRQRIITTGEWIGQKIEEEADRARRDETEEYRRRQSR